MSSLYVTEQGACLRKRGGTLIVEKDGVELLEVELMRLDAVLIYGNIQFSTQVAVELLKEGVEVAFLTLSGKLWGQLTPPLARNHELRLAQYEINRDPQRILLLARETVRAKLQNSLEVLKQADWRNAAVTASEARDELEHAAASLDKASTLDTLNGLEGAAARAYFTAFPAMLKEPGLFNGRSRRPPLDPVNALLSFGYTLIASRLQALLDARGFDPYLGWLHRPDYGRPSLALDLLEPWRAPWVDRWVVRAFNLKIFQPDDFNRQEDGGFRLNEKAIKRFFVSWDEHVRDPEFERLMRAQLDSAARVLRRKQDDVEHPVFKAH